MLLARYGLTFDRKRTSKFPSSFLEQSSNQSRCLLSCLWCFCHDCVPWKLTWKSFLGTCTTICSNFYCSSILFAGTCLTMDPWGAQIGQSSDEQPTDWANFTDNVTGKTFRDDFARQNFEKLPDSTVYLSTLGKSSVRTTLLIQPVCPQSVRLLQVLVFDWLIDWLIDRSIDYRLVWSINPLFDWLIDWLTDWLYQSFQNAN